MVGLGCPNTAPDAELAGNHDNLAVWNRAWWSSKIISFAETFYREHQNWPLTIALQLYALI